MGLNQGSECGQMLRYIIKGQVQVHIVSRGQGQMGQRYGQSHVWGQRSGTMVFQEADRDSLKSEVGGKRGSVRKEEDALVSGG